MSKPLILLFTFLLIPSILFSKDIQIWTYHNFGPFLISTADKKGLTYDFSNLLTKKSKGAFNFLVSELPRKRINLYLAGGKEAMVIWGNPIWFGDKEKKKYEWSDGILKDKNIVISLKSSNIEYKGPESMIGLRFGGVFGHKYEGFSDLFKTKKIERIDVREELQNLQKINLKRIDFTIMPYSATSFFLRKLKYREKFNISKKTHQKFSRYFLINYKEKKTVNSLNNLIRETLQSKEWKALLKKYKIKN